MSRQIRNPYWAILLLPMALFLLLAAIGTDPDWISIPARIGIFGALAYIGVRYVGRAPMLMWNGDFSAPARNICGFALFIIGSMALQAYSVLFLAYNRPEWLASLYVAPALVLLCLVGLGLVMTSVPRFWPFGGAHGGFGSVASFLFGALSMTALFSAQHMPVLWKIICAFFTGLVHAF